MGASSCCYFSYLCTHLCCVLHPPCFLIPLTTLYMESSSQLLSASPVKLAPLSPPLSSSAAAAAAIPLTVNHNNLTATISRWCPYLQPLVERVISFCQAGQYPSPPPLLSFSVVIPGLGSSSSTPFTTVTSTSSQRDLFPPLSTKLPKVRSSMDNARPR